MGEALTRASTKGVGENTGILGVQPTLAGPAERGDGECGDEGKRGKREKVWREGRRRQ